MTQTAQALVSVKDSIATRLLKVVFSFYFMITITVTLIHMSAEFFHQKNEVVEDLKVIQETFEGGLATALWELNIGQIRSTFLGIIKFPTIIGVKIENHNGKILGQAGLITNEKGEPVSVDPDDKYIPFTGFSGLFWHEFPINFFLDNNPNYVGKATIYSSSGVVFQKVKLVLLRLIQKQSLKWF